MDDRGTAAGTSPGLAGAAGPLVIVLIFSFLTKGSYGGVALPFTGEAWFSAFFDRFACVFGAFFDVFDGACCRRGVAGGVVATTTGGERQGGEEHDKQR